MALRASRFLVNVLRKMALLFTLWYLIEHLSNGICLFTISIFMINLVLISIFSAMTGPF